ncbi:PD-(D/E)XK nuclease family protein [Schaalia sp.]|uniref:PD-(D/E)XK nuclease family protein n=1 Tax=Schaalia sp. TaxID=2691890 RepID=UPI003D0DE09B
MENDRKLTPLARAIYDYWCSTAVQTYLRHMAHPNFWTIMGHGRISYETDYSKMLRWLLDPRGNHGAGTLFASLMTQRLESCPESESPQREVLPHSTVPDSSYIGCETEAIGKNIDILYYNSQSDVAIAIEVKMGSKDHLAGSSAESQLDKYFQAVENHEQLIKNCDQRYYVYLTIDEEKPSVPAESLNHWKCMSYSTLADIARKWVNKVQDDGAVKIARDFIFDLERHVSLRGDSLRLAADKYLESDELKEQLCSLVEGFSDDSQNDSSGILLFDQVSKELEGYGIDRSQLKVLVSAAHESLVERKQDHAASEEAQNLIKMLCERLVGRVLEPNESAEVVPEFRIPGYFEQIRRTRHKGQGIETRVGEDRLFYISAGNKAGRVVFPNDPHGRTVEVFNRVRNESDNWSVSYWLEHFDSLMPLMRELLDLKHRDFLDGKLR